LKNKLHINLRVLVTVILLSCYTKSLAQPYFFRHYQVENGLSNNTVLCSVQDNEGFLWFGTKDGMNRFDGYHFKHYNTSYEGYSMEPDMISSMVVDKQNRLWVGCQKGLYFFDKKNEVLIPFIDSLKWINAMYLNKDDELWFVSAQMLCRYNLKTKQLVRFPDRQYFPATNVAGTPDGNVWACTANGFLERYNATTNDFTSYNVFARSPSATSNWIQKINCINNNTIYIGTSAQGLKKLDISTGNYADVLTYNPDKTSIYIRDIKKYSDNEYWFATESGIFIENAATGKFINLKKSFINPYSLSDNAIYSLCKDREGGMWAGTYFGGINYYSEQYAVFQKYFPDNSSTSISGNAVREICGDNNGNIWIGTEDAGLNKLNPATGEITQFKPTGAASSIAHSNIHGLLINGNDLWIGTFDHGLDVMDIKTGKVKKHYNAGPGKYDIQHNFVVTMLKTKSGDIYTGSAGSLFKYLPQVDGFEVVKEVDPNVFVAALTEDHTNTIWAGSHGSGIFFYHPATGKHGYFHNEPGNKNSLPNNIINALYEDSNYNLWIATEGGGLVKLDKERKKFTSYTTKEGMPSNFIFKILEDDKQHLWVTTSRGLVDFYPLTETITIYTKDNGLLNDQFNYNSGYKDSTGKMYFGSTKGMISFEPGNLKKVTPQTPLFITGFQVQNKEALIGKNDTLLKQSILYTNEISLPYDKSSFSIDFAALSFISPEMTTYSYIMEGLDKEWTAIKTNRKIYFTNLLPGTYTFRLKVARNGQWTSAEKTLMIIILPPWWATGWAYTIYIIVLLALIYYLLRSYLIIVEDKKEKEIYEAKIDFFTNLAHEIKTPLTLIKGPVDNLLEKVDDVAGIKEDVATMDRNTNRLIELVSQIMDFRKIETKGFSLDFVRLNISELLRENHLNFLTLAKKRNLDYQLDMPSSDVIGYADEDALQKIFSNLISNAVKYAHKKVSVVMTIDLNNNRVIIRFENDGAVIPDEMREKIFEPFYRIKDVVKKQGTGLGLALARSLTELHNGKLYFESAKTGMNIFILSLPLQPAE